MFEIKLNKHYLSFLQKCIDIMIVWKPLWIEFFCGIVDGRKTFSIISSPDHCQRSSPSQISDTPRAGFEPAQNLSSGIVEWSCAVVITTTPRRHKIHGEWTDTHTQTHTNTHIYIHTRTLIFTYPGCKYQVFFCRVYLQEIT